MPFRKLSLCAAALLFLGCGGGGSSSGNGSSGGSTQTLAGPTNLTATSSGDPMSLTIQWTAPQETVTGYFLDYRKGTGSFSPLNSSPLSPAYTQIFLTFNTTAPEDTDFGFRVYGVSGSVHTDYSNIATYHLGVFAPGQPAGAYDLDAGGVRLNWTRNTVVGDGLRIERAACDAYGTISGTWSSLAVPDPLASTYLDITATQGSYFLYRVTNLHGPLASPVSPVSAPIFAGFAGPAWVQAYWNGGAGAISVSWASTSQTIDGALIERCPANSSGLPSGTWSTVGTAASGATNYSDTSWIEGVGNFYRVSYRHGTQYSPATVTTYAATASLLPPKGLQVTSIPGGFHLAWQNQSQAATQVAISRGPSALGNTTVAILAPNTVSYDDTSLPGLGYYTYQVVASNSTSQAASNSVTVATPNPVGSLALTASPLNTPDAADAAMRPGGAWAFATAQPFGILSNNDPWAAYFPNNAARSSLPIIEMDAQDHPHAVYLVADPQNSTQQDLTHVWYDGSSWKSEVMAKGQVPWTSGNPGYVFTLDGSGTPQALMDSSASSYPYGDSTTTLTYVHKVGGTWTTDSLSTITPAINNIGTYHIHLDSSDAPHLLLGNWSSIVECSKDPQGNWISTTLPAGSAQAGWYDYLDGEWKDGNTASVFYERSGPGSPSTTLLMAIQKINGTWQTPVVLGSRDFDGSSSTAGAAMSFDRSRVAVFRNSSVGLKAYHQDANGAWHETLVAPSGGSYPWIRAGIDGSNKIHVLTKTIGSGYMDYHE